MSDIIIREIEEKDNQPLKTLVINTLAEFGVVSNNCSNTDSELDNLYRQYNKENNFYFVVEIDNQVLGGAGCITLKNLNDLRVCELRKMYFDKQLRGLGMGEKLLDVCIEKAEKLGFDLIQLETMPAMSTAQNLYSSRGFEHKVKSKTKNKKSSCHQACQVFMVKQL